MKEALEKIENFLFDIMGLLIPGLIFLGLFAISTSLLVDTSTLIQIYNKLSNSVPLVTFTKYSFGNGLNKLDLWAYIIIILFAGYLIGHVLKVFSKTYYDMFVHIFDEGLNKYIFPKLVFYLKWNKFLTKFLKNSFSFRPNDYDLNNKEIYNYVLNEIKQSSTIDFPNRWYSIYKYSKIIGYTESYKNLSDRFLVKYNLYRSLSFIFAIHFIYIFSVFSYSTYFASLLIALVVNYMFWYTFHEKYKRYYALCGNEALMAIFYYFTKKKGNDSL